MIRFASVALIGTGLVFAQDHHASVNEHGDQVMGFSHEKTTHHFELSYEGGAIDVRADDVKDTESRDQIRSHFHHIVQMFSDGNFNAPMLVHSTNVPGTATMTKLKDELHWSMTEAARGSPSPRTTSRRWKQSISFYDSRSRITRPATVRWFTERVIMKGNPCGELFTSPRIDGSSSS
jgi:hypothetical protein